MRLILCIQSLIYPISLVRVHHHLMPGEGSIEKNLQEINEYIKMEQNSLKFQYRIGQRDILKWVLEE
jgi:hypothetical protein